jgi:hypothetical protein
LGRIAHGKVRRGGERLSPLLAGQAPSTGCRNTTGSPRVEVAETPIIDHPDDLLEGRTQRLLKVHDLILFEPLFEEKAYPRLFG